MAHREFRYNLADNPSIDRVFHADVEAEKMSWYLTNLYRGRKIPEGVKFPPSVEN